MQRDTFFSFSLFAKRYDPFIVSTTMIRYMQAGYYGPTALCTYGVSNYINSNSIADLVF